MSSACHRASLRNRATNQILDRYMQFRLQNCDHDRRPIRRSQGQNARESRPQQLLLICNAPTALILLRGYPTNLRNGIATRSNRYEKCRRPCEAHGTAAIERGNGAATANRLAQRSGFPLLLVARLTVEIRTRQAPPALRGCGKANGGLK